MKERGILFSAAMVRATLVGAKIQTRRIVKLPVEPTFRGGWEPDTIGGADGAKWSDGSAVAEFAAIGNHTTGTVIGSPWSKGDRLWVRETWTHDAESLAAARASHEDAFGSSSSTIYYRATESTPKTIAWRSGIHMPRWASRITLEVVSIRVEQLQSITASDAVAEGVVDDARGWDGNPMYPLAKFKTLWIHLNGVESWHANPWVWAVAFKRIEEGS